MTQDPARIESRYALPLYCASKAAVTMLTTQYAKELKEVKVNAADPGQTATTSPAASGTASPRAPSPS
ncbi:SDR family NAD(P)-dependent oxidoreductase [Actinoallomurus iriomotensis]|nr:SDR family NAD(P)-dependent oxidoreductase [Actinoallomurus iriomotensis]